MSKAQFAEGAAPGTPATGKVVIYAKSDGVMYMKDDAGTETAMSGGGSSLPVVDTTGIAKGSVDATKIVRFEVDGLTTATTRVLTVPDADLTIVGTATTQTLTNKTLTTPTIGDFTNATHTHQNAAGGGTLDHGLALTGLTDDDHTQYVLLAGRATGQTVIGGTASGDDLTLKSTSNATKGSLIVSETIDVSLHPYGASAGNTASLRFLELAANGTNFIGLKAADNLAASVTFELPDADGTYGQALVTDGTAVLFWENTITNPMSANLDMGGFDFVDDSGTVTTSVSGGSNISLTASNSIGPASSAITVNPSSITVTSDGNTTITADVGIVITNSVDNGSVTLRSQYNSVTTFEVNNNGVITTGTIDHGSNVTGLSDDDHTQYVLLAGRSGGQTITGGTASGNDLTIRSTTNATKGSIIVEQTQDISVHPFGASAGNTTELRLLELAANGVHYTGWKSPDSLAGNLVYTMPTADGSSGQLLSTNGSATLSWATASGSGTVTHTGGALTANAVVLGAGADDVKVVTGITTDGTSVLNLGVDATTIGKVKMFGNTSGDATIQPAAVAGTATVLTLPASTDTLVGRATTDTLTNKTLTSPVIADFTSAQHDHQDADDGGTLDHGLALTGLTDDDHTQYALLAGRATGQVLIGGTAASEDLTIKSTSNATKGSLIIDETVDVSLKPHGTSAGNTAELRFLELAANGSNYMAFKAADAMTASVTYTLPAADGSNNDVLTTDGAGILTWEPAGAGSSPPFADTQTIVKGSADATKLLRIEVDGFTTGTTRVITPPDEDFTIVGVATTQTLTNKTLTTPTIGSFTNAAHNHQDAAGGATLSITSATTGTLTATRGGTGQSTFAQGDLIYTSAADTLSKLTKGTANQVFRMNAAATVQEWKTLEQSRSITIDQPTSAVDLGMFYTDVAITVTKMACVLVGSSSPSVTWTIRHDPDRSATGNSVVTGGTTTTSTTTGSIVTSFNDASIPAASYVWFETTAKSGTVASMQTTIIFTTD